MTVPDSVCLLSACDGLAESPDVSPCLVWQRWVAPHPLRERIKHAPEDLLGEEQLLLRRHAVAAPARRQAVILPVLLVVIGQQLVRTHTQGKGQETQNSDETYEWVSCGFAVMLNHSQTFAHTHSLTYTHAHSPNTMAECHAWYIKGNQFFHASLNEIQM